MSFVSAHDAPETGTVTCRVIDVWRTSAPKVVALASVELEVDGIVLTIHGVQVVHAAAGLYGATLRVKLPSYRAPDGSWKPALAVPKEVERPLGDAVLEFCRDHGIL